MSEQSLRAAVQRVRAEHAQRYGFVVDTSSWGWNDGPTVEGGVLTSGQARAYADAVREATGHEAQPPVLSALDADWRSLRWARLSAFADLHRDASGDDRQTQWAPPAWLRCFGDVDTRSLVQLEDGTLGWVQSDLLAPEIPREDPWAPVARPRIGEAVPTAGGLDDAEAAARARLGTPYLWGGNGPDGTDCSGFVQTVLREAAGVLLPKHTGDQRRFGARVAADAIAPGDLVFVVGRQRRVGHVGLHTRDGVFHACLTRGEVLLDALPDFLERFRFVAARRVVAW